MTSFVESPSRPLSLHIDGPASASPFPSPSSSFLPPPVPGAHEFAVKPPPRKKSTPNVSAAAVASSQSTDNAPSSDSAEGSGTENRVPPGTVTADSEAIVTEPSITTIPQQSCSSESQQSLPQTTSSSDSLTAHQDIDMLSPTTPTPGSLHFSSAAGSATAKPPATPTQSDIQPHSRPSSTSYHPSSLSQSQTSQSRGVPLSPVLTHSPSLASSRAAPPSPAASRRTSTISARSSKSNTSDSFSPSHSRRQSKRSSTGFGGINLGLTSVSGGTGTGSSKRQSTLSALSTGSGSGVLAPQSEGDEDTTAPVNATTPTIATSPSNIASTAPNTATIVVTPTSASTPNKPTATKPRNRRRSNKIKIHIRDFAYTKSDDKYRGLGSDVPKPNRFARLNKKLGGSKKVRPSSRRWSTASESTTGVASGDDANAKSKDRHRRSRADDDDEEEDDDDDDDDDDDEDDDGWFKRGMGRFSWSFGLSNLRKQVQQEEEERQRKEREAEAAAAAAAASANNKFYPSRDEMDYNFSTTEDNQSSGRSSEVYYDAEDSGITDPHDNDIATDEPFYEGAEQEGAEQDEEEEEEEELFPGQYRAMFAFEPEGTAEMRLIEDQIVRVVGRGGGVGWAVVVVPEGAEGGVEVAPGVRHALVPESYLEVVELD